MTYLLEGLRSRISGQAGSLLGLKGVVVEDANPKFGADLAVPCFTAAMSLGENPSELAKKIADGLKQEWIERVETQGGYVNIWLNPSVLAGQIISESSKSGYGVIDQYQNQEILVEFTDPNPFKELHIGHLYSNTVGESIARLHEAAGARVHRVSYHGDVGLHIARAVWGIKRMLGADQSLQEISKQERPRFLGQAYALGAKAYKENDSAKAEIDSLNKQIYELSDPDLKNLYETGRQWSFDYFESVFRRVGVSFEKQYLESEAGKRGLIIVREHIGDVFETSDGAVVFRGEDFGLHTRVFINSQGLPTYEAKDLALPLMKAEDYKYDKSIIITANEQNEYFAVMLTALARFEPDLARKTVHLGHGEVRLPSGKMSSRTGDVVTAVQLLDQVEQAVSERAPDSPSIKENALAAIKYAFLKQNIGGDVVYDIEDSIGLEGQTGPYVQYAAVRAQSVLAKVGETGSDFGSYDWQAERAVLIRMARFPEVIKLAVNELAPHRVAQYVYDLARDLNRFYEQTPVKDAPDDARAARVALLRSAINVFAQSLTLLNIPLPEKM